MLYMLSTEDSIYSPNEIKQYCAGLIKEHVWLKWTYLLSTEDSI